MHAYNVHIHGNLRTYSYNDMEGAVNIMTHKNAGLLIAHNYVYDNL